MKYISALTLLVMLAFAGNSILVRLALSTDSIGSLSFSIIRLLAGALVLALIAKPKHALESGSWTSALYLLAYVFFFSYAYLALDAGNFVKASACVVAISIPLLFVLPEQHPSTKGIVLAIISGAITSGLGYTLWYKVLPHLPATRSSIAQLSVPAIAAIGGMIFCNRSRVLIGAAYDCSFRYFP